MASDPQRVWYQPPLWWVRSRTLRVVLLLGLLLTLSLMLWRERDRVFGPHINPQAAVYQQVESLRMNLAGFSSYDAPDTVLAALRTAGYTAKISHDDDADSSRYPPHHLATATVQGYRHLGCDGKLALEFFNRRLYEVDFYPANAARYAVALHHALPGLKRNRVGDAQWIAGDLRVASNVDLARSEVGKALDTQAYAIWQDLRLIHQRDQWDRDYGSIPIAPK
ncbi:MAG: hypothetical protein ACRESS_01855 [Stenotrophobium sp.]